MSFLRKLKEKIMDMGGAEVLDDLVHDVSHEKASEINNGGVDDQLDYLIGCGMTPEDILRLTGAEDGNTNGEDHGNGDGRLY